MTVISLTFPFVFFFIFYPYLLHCCNGSITNSDEYLIPPKIVRKYGYTSETHIVLSEDGYLLELHRIPNGKINSVDSGKRKPILLHHGILSSSVDWIVNGPKKSLAYKLSDAGYDVWLANARGNTYSRSHVSKNPDSEDFWTFSLHEMGYYDLPAMIDFILEKSSSEKLTYIGHSMGTTVFYIMSSTRPEYNGKINLHVGLAPVAFLGHTTSPVRHFAPYAREIQSLSEWYYKGAFLEHDMLEQRISIIMCGLKIFKENLCKEYIVFYLFGKDEAQFNDTVFSTVTKHLPAGTSGRALVHYSQIIESGKFQNFDYGVINNIKKYNVSTPPAYNVSRMNAPMRLYYGQNDPITNLKDINNLYYNIPKPMGLVKLNYDKFNHVDFMWSKDINKLLYDDLLGYLEKMKNNASFAEYELSSAILDRNEKRSQDNWEENNEIQASQPSMEREEKQLIIADRIRKNIQEIKASIEQNVSRVDRGLRDSQKFVGKAIDDAKSNVRKYVGDVEKIVDETTEEWRQQWLKTLRELQGIFNNTNYFK